MADPGIALYFGLGVLTLLALLVVLWAFSKTRQSGAQSNLHLQSQQAFFHQRLGELQADLSAGVIDQSQFNDLERELKRQLVSETDSRPDFRRASASRIGFFALMVLIPLVALGLYHLLGYREDLQLRAMQRQLVEAEQLTPAMLAEFETQLGKALAKRGDSPDLLAMMASLRRQAGDFAGAEPYYQRLLALFPEDANLMAQLGQARYLANNRQLDSATRALLHKALSIEPSQSTALGVLGIDAFASGDFGQAIALWQRLLPSLAPGSTEQAVIQQGLAAAKQRAIAAGTLRGISVAVALAPDLNTPVKGVLFVVAKSADGNPMPVAALRQQVGPDSFPVSLVLTDADVIRQGKTLADFEPLVISAHISRHSTAIRQPGDLTASPQDYRSGDGGPLTLQIDQQVAAP